MADNKRAKKGGRKKWEFPIGIEPMTREDAAAEMERFFKALEDQYKDIPPDEIERGARKIQDFLGGKMNWAELFNFTPEMLFQMAEFGFTQFKSGRYEDAERIFKVLTVLDWNNAYYHSVMGSILQRQRRYGEAIAEYTQAIELDPNDIVSRTNRGEIFMQHGLFEEAEEDFKQAIALDKGGADKFANRSRMLMQQMERVRKEEKGKIKRG
ncbi:MAG: tetratricopeptide repeat protein [Pseudomonadota bacterium]